MRITFAEKFSEKNYGFNRYVLFLTSIMIYIYLIIMKHLPWFSLNLSKFLQAEINIFLFKIMPYRISQIYLHLLGKIYYRFKKNEKLLIEKTIHHIYNGRLAPNELKKLIEEVFKGIFTHYHEKLFVAYSNYTLLKKRFFSWVTITGEDEFKAALAGGKGILLVTAHYGAVEWLPGSLAARGYPVTMILRFQTRKLKRTTEKIALEMKDAEILDLNDGNVIFAAIEALKSGRILVTECDEFDTWRKSKKISVDFLGQTMQGDKTLDILRKRTGAAVATALMHRNGPKDYTLKLNTLDAEEAAANPLGKITMEILDEQLKESPEQWYQWKDFGEELGLM
ncbi:MAG TPA: hypothetical protein DCO79_02570 [Spirochaeta sp.]|nr:hypothetical protein [Spirochaeta sp.]